MSIPITNQNFKPIRPSVLKIWCILEIVKVKAIPVWVKRVWVKGRHHTRCINREVEYIKTIFISVFTRPPHLLHSLLCDDKFERSVTVLFLYKLPCALVITSTFRPNMFRRTVDFVYFNETKLVSRYRYPGINLQYSDIYSAKVITSTVQYQLSEQTTCFVFDTRLSCWPQYLEAINLTTLLSRQYFNHIL